MAKNLITNATVVIAMNGKQANETMKSLQKEAERLDKQFQEAKASGNKINMDRARKALQQVREQLNLIRTNTVQVEEVMRKLDRATPAELNKTLATLRRQLNGMERGSEMWDKQVAKIKLVEAELKKVNAAMRTQESRWSRMNRWINDTQTFLMGAAAAVTGLVMAGRKAVNEFAQIEEALANTRKYTGMTVETVGELNEKFLQMDTRTSREQLNLLAQEGGRLGKNTLESVQGYVEAADIINVALVDLGEGATQTIAKISNIFGIEQQLGTKQAMLSIGSAVNVLSQNCTASKPYLVDFAQRMAGIGAQAGLTVPQILAFGAVLDANGQKVEMSATAIQKIIMALANKNQEFSKVLGLDADKLSKTLRASAKDGILMYLEGIKQLSDKTSASNATTALAPLFKDMGMDAARVATVLSTLANHIDEVKWQMGEADKAFREATSATKEYEIFNNTAQAAIDKAKKRVSELAIELGEKLYPIMKHIYTSSGIFLRVLNQIVSFLIEHKKSVVTLTASIVAYYVAVQIATVKTKTFAAVQFLCNKAAVAGRAAVLLLNAAFYAAIGNIGKASAALRVFNTVTKLNPVGLLVGVMTALSSILFSTKKKVDEYTKSMDDAMTKVNSFTVESMKEQQELDKLFGKLEGAKKGTKEYQKAKDTIIQKYGIYLKGLIDEKGEIINLAEAYERLSFSIKKSSQVRGYKLAREGVEDNYIKEVELQTENLRKILIEWGALGKNASKISTQVAQALIKGEKVPSKVMKAIQTVELVRGTGATSTWAKSQQVTPLGIVSGLESKRKDYSQRIEKLNELNPRKYEYMFTEDLDDKIEKLEKLLSSPKNVKIQIDIKKEDGKTYRHTMSRNLAKNMLNDMRFERAQRLDQDSNIDEDIPDDFEQYQSDKAKEQEDKKKAAEERRELLKKKQEFRDGLAAIKAEYEKADAEIIQSYAKGELKYLDYLKARNDAEQKYYSDSRKYYEDNFSSIKDIYLEHDKDYQALLNNKEEAFRKYNDKRISYESGRIRKDASFKEDQENQNFKASDDRTIRDEVIHRERLRRIREQSYRDELDIRIKGSREWEDLQLKMEQESQDARLDIERMFQQKVAVLRKQYGSNSAVDRYSLELTILQQLLDAERISLIEFEEWKRQLQQKYAKDLPGSDFERTPEEIRNQREDERQKQFEQIDEAVAAGLISEDEGERRKNAIDSTMIDEMIEKVKNCGNEWVSMIATLGDAWKDLWESLDSDSTNVLDNIGNVASATFSIVGAGMQMASQFAQANAQIEQAKIEKRYAREAELAQGNSYLLSKLEKQKEKEIAEAKNKASKASFNMQIIQAIGQTIQGGINAYTSTAAIPMIGPALAPAAAAVAVAAGMMNVALLKKQQQASEAQGYAEGGFTKPGGKYDVAGVVHAGEWVASQKLVSSPVTRPMIELLERAQRTNSFGSLRPEDASRVVATGAASLPANASGQTQQVNVVMPRNEDDKRTLARLSEAVERLSARLDDPIMAISTVTGKYGSKSANDEYKRYISNKNKKR